MILMIVEALGIATPRQPIPPTPETITTINYTSGTTGMPKGAVLTHANAVAALVGPKLMEAIDGNPGDTIMSFLPLAHIYERENVNMCLYAGMRIGFFHGDVTGVSSLLVSLTSAC
jgi:long-chain acyl-CoA synthetase